MIGFFEHASISGPPGLHPTGKKLKPSQIMRVSNDLIVDGVGFADPPHGRVVGFLPTAGEPFKLKPASPGEVTPTQPGMLHPGSGRDTARRPPE